MLGWLFRPSCPCDPAAKAWVEERLQWLTEEFEDSAFTGRPLVLPTPEFFPDPYDGSRKAVRVLLGLGIFLANTPRNWDADYKKWPETDLNKPEYMTPPMFGYALAHLAWFRGEAKPDWARHLHWNARGDFRRALRFLHEVGESEYKP